MTTRIARTAAVLALCTSALCTVALAGPAVAAPSRPSLPRPTLTWELRPTGVDAQFRGLDVVRQDQVWLAGSGGTVLRTVDGGEVWQDVSPAAANGLELRDVEAFDARHAVVLAIGPGEDSRIYRTNDGGQSWRETFVNDDPNAFYNCTAFFDRRHGLTVGDPVDGKFAVLETDDGGRSWQKQSGARMPAAIGGEFNFAASGTCLVAGPGGRAWFASGGTAARVFRTDDHGHSWNVHDTPVAPGASAGIYSLGFDGPWHGLAVGGDYTAPDRSDDATAVSDDGGQSWQLVDAGHAPGGYRSGSAWLRPFWGLGMPIGLAVGPTGSDVSFDGGWSWHPFDTGSFDSVDCAAGTCWSSGPDGRAARLAWEHH